MTDTNRIQGPVDAVFTYYDEGYVNHISTRLSYLDVHTERDREDCYLDRRYIVPPAARYSFNGDVTLVDGVAFRLDKDINQEKPTMKITKEVTIHLPRTVDVNITLAELYMAQKTCGAPDHAKFGHYDYYQDDIPVWTVYFEWEEDV